MTSFLQAKIALFSKEYTGAEGRAVLEKFKFDSTCHHKNFLCFELEQIRKATFYYRVPQRRLGKRKSGLGFVPTLSKSRLSFEL